MVLKRDGGREPFDKEKLKTSLGKALAKRNITAERLDRIAQAIIEVVDVKANPKRHGYMGLHVEVTSKYLGQLCLDSLKELDFVAYVRYASVFNKFHSLADFDKCMDTLTVRTPSQ